MHSSYLFTYYKRCTTQNHKRVIVVLFNEAGLCSYCSTAVLGEIEFRSCGKYHHKIAGVGVHPLSIATVAAAAAVADLDPSGFDFFVVVVVVAAVDS